MKYISAAQAASAWRRLASRARQALEQFNENAMLALAHLLADPRANVIA